MEKEYQCPSCGQRDRVTIVRAGLRPSRPWPCPHCQARLRWGYRGARAARIVVLVILLALLLAVGITQSPGLAAIVVLVLLALPVALAVFRAKRGRVEEDSGSWWTRLSG